MRHNRPESSLRPVRQIRVREPLPDDPMARRLEAFPIVHLPIVEAVHRLIDVGRKLHDSRHGDMRNTEEVCEYLLAALYGRRYGHLRTA